MTSINNSNPNVSASSTTAGNSVHPSAVGDGIQPHTASLPSQSHSHSQSHNSSNAAGTDSSTQPGVSFHEKHAGVPDGTNANAGADGGSSAGPNDLDAEGYPEQRHAGKVGYGPNYNQGAGFTDKVAGLKEEVIGKLTKNTGKVQEGHDKRTGELKHKQQEEDMAGGDAFATPEEKEAKKKQEQGQGAASTTSTTSASTTSVSDSNSPNNSTTTSDSNRPTPSNPSNPSNNPSNPSNPSNNPNPNPSTGSSPLKKGSFDATDHSGGHDAGHAERAATVAPEGTEAGRAQRGGTDIRQIG